MSYNLPSSRPAWRQLASIRHGPLSPAFFPVGHQRAVSTPNIWLYFFPWLLMAKAMHSHGVKCDLVYTWLQLAKRHGSPGDGDPS